MASGGAAMRWMGSALRNETLPQRVLTSTSRKAAQPGQLDGGMPANLPDDPPALVDSVRVVAVVVFFVAVVAD
jgi:hypothetical protein